MTKKKQESQESIVAGSKTEDGLNKADGNESNINEQKYPTALLAKSEALKSFRLHRDVIYAILCKQEYTIRDAKQAIQKYIDSFEK